ncbi:protein kinase C-binding protein NELL1-like isoform X5 [Vespa velutina]|uniref:protein kinase C-binding protein NELL1-like isoform X5 n=1 Tax=Vespa velutina TaxID=202808 RepID=UPI001FB27BA0|nr:protein kinase C-binding protein NELL1-like isoform X5 [Vespa velutina]
MYYGPVIDPTGSSCSASDHHRRQRDHHYHHHYDHHQQHQHQHHRRPQQYYHHHHQHHRHRHRLLPSPTTNSDSTKDEPAYVLLLRSPKRPAAASCCHTARRPGRRRRDGGHAVRIFLVATAAAFLALAVSPVSGTSNKKEEETTVVATSVGVTEESGVLGTTRSKPGNDPGGGIDLLAALQLHNTTRQGVTQVPGLVRLKAAYYLQGEERELRLSEASFKRAAALLRRVPEFTIAAALRQEEANSGTIVAFSHGNNRYLELQSSGRKDELRLHYVSRRDGSVHAEAFPFRLADGVWHRVALSISGSQVELLVDCHPLYRRLLRPGPPDTNFTLPQLQLWIGQRNARHFLFKGALQDVKLVPGPHGYLSQCPQLDSSCPTCGQFSMLQNTVEQLMHNLNELTRRLAAAEGRINKVEECECQKSCRANGTVHEDGATWEKGCQQCSCVHGEIECRPTPCAPVTCKNPVIPQEQCCPICLKQCYLHGVIYDHGVKVSPKQCVECDCYDGSFTCQRFDTETRCPPLPCPPSEQISVAEECCKYCPGVDYCAKGHKCHANASCLNLQTTYACHCDIGFQGDGHNCHDVDECKQQGGSEGHHCNANTRCVNVIGSYTCECLPGYHRVDKFNCAELDECVTGHHTCDEHATCVNTAGSYYCVCKDGYAGDGHTCKPICNQTCQNGGECVAPGRCSCRRGYIGNSCELDLDECASDLHRCHQSSSCFNMPGWYYCRCKPGYRSALHDSTQGTQCLDIDECNDHTIERRHTCHPSAKCVNTEGGYACACPREDNNTDEECRLSCWFEDREVENGDTLAPAGNPCRRCTCNDGVITCREPICDCSLPGSRKDKCCPQCDPAASCRHQELHHLVFRSGERWIYQCQTCECLYGEIDCWQMECPPVTCSNPITEDGDCCPRCEDDPCAREVTLNGTSLSVLSHPRPCSYAGIIHDSGSSWQDPHDKCTTCECKVPYCAQLDGQLCCSYDYGCAGDLGDEQQQRDTIGAPESLVQPLSDATRWSLVEGTQEAAVPAVTRSYHQVESVSSSYSSSIYSSSSSTSGNSSGNSSGPGRKVYLGSSRQQFVQSRNDRRARVLDHHQQQQQQSQQQQQQQQQQQSQQQRATTTSSTSTTRSQQGFGGETTSSTVSASRGTTMASTTSPTKSSKDRNNLIDGVRTTRHRTASTLSSSSSSSSFSTSSSSSSSYSSSSTSSVSSSSNSAPTAAAATATATATAASSSVTLLVPSSSTIDDTSSTFASKTATSETKKTSESISSIAATVATTDIGAVKVNTGDVSSRDRRSSSLSSVGRRRKDDKDESFLVRGSAT